MTTRAEELRANFTAGRNDKYAQLFPQKIPDPEEEKDFLYDKFPQGFLFGASTAAYQVEGGSNEDGKGETMWDHLVRTKPEMIEDGSNADQGCDSYHRYMDDVELLKNLGANVYRFSLCWARILPNGDPSEINQGGVDYYNRLIDLLIENGIEPIVTLLHFDMPQALAAKYNWLNFDLAPYFVDFAQVCFEKFGDRVKYWMTINEPWLYSIACFDLGLHPPFMRDSSVTYQVLHNLMKTHALVYRLYEREFRERQKGKVGIAVDAWGIEPMDSSSPEDLAATERAWQFKLGCMTHPLIFGEYPPLMRELVDAKSKEEGRSESRLPQFDEEWSKKIKGSFDFLGMNHYTCEKVTIKERAPDEKTQIVFSSSSTTGFDADQQNFRFHDPKWPTALSWWLKYTPRAIRSTLNYFKDNYGNPEIIITENGWSDERANMEDVDRVHYFKGYLNEVLKSIRLDGCNVRGYCAWSLLDSWEWNAGHTVSFGIHHVDLEDPERKRTPRASAKYLAHLYKNAGFVRAEEGGSAKKEKSDSVYRAGMGVPLVEVNGRAVPENN